MTSGSVFGVSIGMGQGEAHRVLQDAGGFKLRFRSCLKPATMIDAIDHLPGSNGCGGEELLEVWRADTFMRLAGWETLDLHVRDGRVVRIRWFRAVGYPG
jgi:hypothetical protein